MERVRDSYEPTTRLGIWWEGDVLVALKVILLTSEYLLFKEMRLNNGFTNFIVQPSCWRGLRTVRGVIFPLRVYSDGFLC